jgi:hypothetical protein
MRHQEGPPPRSTFSPPLVATGLVPCVQNILPERVSDVKPNGQVRMPARVFPDGSASSRLVPVREKANPKASPIGQWVWSVRTGLRKTRAEFAEMIEAGDPGTITKWENGDRQSVRNDYLARIYRVATPAMRALCPVTLPVAPTSDPVPPSPKRGAEAQGLTKEKDPQEWSNLAREAAEIVGAAVDALPAGKPQRDAFNAIAEFVEQGFPAPGAKTPEDSRPKSEPRQPKSPSRQ